jgi:hypothetical protein
MTNRTLLVLAFALAFLGSVASAQPGHHHHHHHHHHAV